MIQELIFDYTQATSKLGFGRARKLSKFNDHKLPNIKNMRSLMIVEFRCFGAAENPSFEVAWVFIDFSLKFLPFALPPSQGSLAPHKEYGVF